MNLKQSKQYWNDLAELDPLWAILFDPKKKHNKWNENEFFQSGVLEIKQVVDNARKLGHPKEFKTALDFGCGVGRLTRALANEFDEVYGIDISEKMISLAKEFNYEISNCKFIQNSEKKLSMFNDETFDLIYTNIVLQHIPDKKIIKSYISEFTRILKKDGLLVFQLPTFLSLKYRLQPRRRLYALMRYLNFDKSFILNTLDLTPILMNFIDENEVNDFLISLNVTVIDTKTFSNNNKNIKWNVYYVKK